MKAIITLAALFIVTPSYAQVNKCKNEKGEIVYQQLSCPKKNEERTIPTVTPKNVVNEGNEKTYTAKIDGKKSALNAQEINAYFDKDVQRAIKEKVEQDQIKKTANNKKIMAAINNADNLRACQKQGCTSSTYRGILIGMEKSTAQALMGNCTTTEIGPYRYLSCYGNLNDGGNVRAAQLQMTIEVRYKNNGSDQEDTVVSLNVY